MELQNETQFPALDFDAIDNHGDTFHTVVARATFEVSEDGMLRLGAEQRPLVMADELYGDLGTSSVKEESDLAPFKPKCDVVVIGTAALPGGQFAKRFEAGITIHRNGTTIVNKRIVVTGPRYWKKRFLPLCGWRLTEPEPIESLPIRYEYSYGGECQIGQDDTAARRIPKKYRLTLDQRSAHPNGAEKAPVAHTCFGDNAVGRGYAEKWYLKAKRLRRIPAPQIESINDPIRKFGKPYAPQGFGVVSKSAFSRRILAGTIDKAFIDSGKSLPGNFDFAFWNGAPADMHIPWLEGNEQITLTNIRGILQVVLPETKVCAEVAYEDGRMAALDFNVDTLIINADQKTISMIYRLKLSPAQEIQTLKIQWLSTQERALLVEQAQSVSWRALSYAEASR